MMLTNEEMLHRVQTHVGGVNPGNLDNSDWISFARAIIAENNKKVLADLTPDLRMVESPVGNFAPYYLHDGMVDNASANKVVTNYYSADQVAALIQERDALAAKLKELEVAYKPFKDMVVAFNNNREFVDRHMRNMTKATS